LATDTYWSRKDHLHRTVGFAIAVGCGEHWGTQSILISTTQSSLQRASGLLDTASRSCGANSRRKMPNIQFEHHALPRRERGHCTRADVCLPFRLHNRILIWDVNIYVLAIFLIPGACICVTVDMIAIRLWGFRQPRCRRCCGCNSSTLLACCVRLCC